MKKYMIFAIAAMAMGCGGPGGTADAGNANADGGMGMDSGMASMLDAGEVCLPEEPLAPASAFPVCDLCANARCVPSAFLPAEQLDSLGDCDDTNKCVPELMIETNGNFTFASCRSLNDAEGRCVSTCLPSAAAQADRLPTEGCQTDEVCVPCFDPFTGEDTGACGLGCDPGATEPPVLFEGCCGGVGSCLPTTAVPAEQQALLGPDTCTGGALCAPDDLVDSEFIPATCTSVADAEGRCLPSCLPSVAAQADLLPQSTCMTGELCTPCYDPTDGEPTGSCSLNGDMPVDPPTTFDRCCGGIGSCVPTSLVPADQLSLLSVDTCTAADQVCAPDLVLASDPPPSCRSLADAEGRCLPSCLPSVAGQADTLPQDTCAEAHLCVPCFDPTTGESTGSCDLNGDAPVETPTTFDRCCGGIGSCVPTSLVPADQLSQLGTDSCTTADQVCAPDSLLSSDPPPSCRSVADAEGRCLPSCLPAVAAQADLLPQGTCDAGHLCAPCFDPTSGDSTGSCDLNGDAPVEPPTTFERCCGGIGACVPSSLVPADQQSQLSADTCSDTALLCAPDELVADDFAPTTCRSIADGEGRCLPSCLPAVAALGSSLPQDVCPATHLCAPCFDPTDGSDTGSCTLNGDMPAEPPYVFPGCCTYDTTDRGRCVPSSSIPADDRGSLEADTCGSADLCVPQDLLDDPAHSFPFCVAGDFLGDGACIPDCMVGGFTGIFLTQETCESGELCAPCTDFFGAETGACR